MRVKVRFGTKVRRNIAAHPWLYILAVPVLAYFIVFHYAPMYGVVIAFKNYKPTLGILGSDWVGLKHFESFVSGLYFERLLRNTISINLGRPDFWLSFADFVCFAGERTAFQCIPARYARRLLICHTLCHLW